MQTFCIIELCNFNEVNEILHIILISHPFSFSLSLYSMDDGIRRWAFDFQMNNGWRKCICIKLHINFQFFPHQSIGEHRERFDALAIRSSHQQWRKIKWRRRIRRRYRRSFLKCWINFGSFCHWSNIGDRLDRKTSPVICFTYEIPHANWRQRF